MHAVEFRKIRKRLINPITGKPATQKELGAILKSTGNIGSRVLVAKIEAGDTPVQPYIADTMETLRMTGWPSVGEQAEATFLMDATETVTSLRVLLEAPEEPDLQDLKRIALQCAHDLGKALGLLAG